ncbi:TetR/AcrR family transcriptional regulator [Paenarthrobacter sp. A20]|uniref:TetR/AcrR family transcriptional regulator n=1 Tax=Paenarthrobacter sp. A20 TaxID=2817891 RepID=UPI0020A1711E|nr:TetR/AcrR family transcriptional regulator [Paenarthrobacter sp. A20]MCP1415729.1 AcrR family transcriptional regulator [Paenarthrobacter sp. A20]
MGLTGIPPAVFMREGNAEDPRSVRTRKLLLDAFERQLDIGQPAPTVASLVHEAGVSRSSFYKHFTGAENVGVAAFRELLDAFHPAADHSQQPPSSSTQVSLGELFEHLGQHRILCSAVLIPDTQAPALLELRTTLISHLTEAIDSVNDKPAELDAKEAATFFVGGILSLLLDWLQRPTQTATDLATVAGRMLPEWLRDVRPLEAPILGLTSSPREQST